MNGDFLDRQILGWRERRSPILGKRIREAETNNGDCPETYETFDNVEHNVNLVTGGLSLRAEDIG